jgi:hypothetical protein
MVVGRKVRWAPEGIRYSIRYGMSLIERVSSLTPWRESVVGEHLQVVKQKSSRGPKLERVEVADLSC